RQFEAPALANALHGGDGRNRQLVEPVERIGEYLNARPQDVGRDTRPLADIAACAEIGTLPAHDNDARLAGGDQIKCVEQLLSHLEIDSVALGMTENNLRNRTVEFEPCKRHDILLTNISKRG